MNTYHIIDHEGFGTIHRLLIPLCDKYKDHKLYTTGTEYAPLTDAAIECIRKESDSFLIIHSTGKLKTKLLMHFRDLFPNHPAALFLHTSYKYQELKGRGDMIYDLLHLTNQYRMNVLVPSKETAEQYAAFDIPVHAVQLGIPDVAANTDYFEYKPELEAYYNKIITTCASDQPIYQFVKGIDRFETIIADLHLEKDALIAGIDRESERRILTKRFSTDDFLNVLCHANAYVQLSRYETYNLTAVQAKQLMVPTLVLGVEGANSCMGDYAYSSEAELITDLRRVLDGHIDSQRQIYCRFDSRWRESLTGFYSSLTLACMACKGQGSNH